MFLTTIRRPDLIVVIILLRYPVLCGGTSVQWAHHYTLFTCESRLINVESFPTYVYRDISYMITPASSCSVNVLYEQVLDNKMGNQKPYIEGQTTS